MDETFRLEDYELKSGSEVDLFEALLNKNKHYLYMYITHENSDIYVGALMLPKNRSFEDYEITVETTGITKRFHLGAFIEEAFISLYFNKWVVI